MLAGKIDVFLKITTAATIAQSFIEHFLCSKHVFVLRMHILFHVTLNSLMYQKKSLISKEIKSPAWHHLRICGVWQQQDPNLGSYHSSGQMFSDVQCYYFFHLFFFLSLFSLLLF